MNIEIEDTDQGFDKLMKTLRGLDGQAAYVGLFEPELATRGHRHELGEGVPERPWLGPATDQATQRGLTVAANELGLALDGKQSGAEALAVTGAVFENAARTYVEAGNVGGPPLTELAKRRDPRKLIDTGEMIGALETRVADSIEGEDA